MRKLRVLRRKVARQQKRLERDHLNVYQREQLAARLEKNIRELAARS